MTAHPCRGMTKAQKEAFERIAINEHPRCGWLTLDALLARGVIKRGEGETRKDAMGTYEIPSFFVPLPIHIQWCQWCSEHAEEEV